MSLNGIDSLESNAPAGSFAIVGRRSTFRYTFLNSGCQRLIGTTAFGYGRTPSDIFGWNDPLSRSESELVTLDGTLSWMRTDREVNDIDLNPQHLVVQRVGGN